MKVLATPLSAGSKALQILLHLNKRLHHVWCGFLKELDLNRNNIITTMKKLQIILAMAAIVLLASCSKKSNEPKAITFEVYEQKAEVKVPLNDPNSFDSEWTATMRLMIDIPIGDSEAEDNVKKGILEIIGRSKLATFYGSPTGNTIKEVASNYVSKYKERLKKPVTEESFYYEPVLIIRCVYQNEGCAVMAVTDGGDRIETSRIFEGVIRLSDGHLLTNDEIANISKEELMSLARKYADASQTEEIKSEGEYNLSIGPDGLLFHPSQYFETEYAIPMSAVETNLTEEAKALMTARSVIDEHSLSSTEPIKGDLALYDLQGPVKQLQIVTSYSTITYTFDANGWLTSEKHEMDGDVLDDKLFYDRTNRDAQGRAKERFRDSDVKELNTFNDAGQLVKQEYWLGDRLERMTINYFDDQGRRYKSNELGTVHATYYYNGTTKYPYSECQYDKYGNYTEQIGEEGKRIITYFE